MMDRERLWIEECMIGVHLHKIVMRLGAPDSNIYTIRCAYMLLTITELPES